MTLMVAAVLAAAPLSVRVLEQARPAEVTLEGTALGCDGAPLDSPVRATAGVREVHVGELRCAVVTARGGVTVSVPLAGEDGPLRRTYPGDLTVSLEGIVLKLVNEVDVEAYLPGVVHAEAQGLPRAAQEAQAIVSRTFALASRHRHGATHDLCDLAHCQAYHGAVSGPAREAASRTAGRVLLLGGMVLKPTHFHAACGGHTSAAADVFGDAEVSSVGVPDLEGGAPRCEKADGFRWSVTVERQELARALGLRDQGEPIETLRRDVSGRTLEARLFGLRVSGDELVARLNRALGFGTVNSARFTTQEVEGVVRIEGTGRGHGVGLCQAGAARLATQGADATAILRRYFPGSRLAPVPAGR